MTNPLQPEWLDFPALVTILQDNMPILQSSGVVWASGKNCPEAVWLPSTHRNQFKTGDEVRVEYRCSSGFFRTQTIVEMISDKDEGLEVPWPACCLHLRRMVWHRIEQRRHFRVSLAVPVRHQSVVFPVGFEWDERVRKRAIAEWGGSLAQETWFQDAYTVDLTPHGVRISTVKAHFVGDELCLQIEFDKQRVILAGRVLADMVREPLEGKSARHELSIVFVGLSVDMQEWLALVLQDITSGRSSLDSVSSSFS